MYDRAKHDAIDMNRHQRGQFTASCDTANIIKFKVAMHLGERFYGNPADIAKLEQAKSAVNVSNALGLLRCCSGTGK